jgi:uncharacterized protein (TIGR03437 family)
VVDIHGRSLTATTAVRFNGVPARILHNTDTSLRVLVPAGAASGKVDVTTRYGQATSKATFVVKPPLKPLIQRVSPDPGPASPSAVQDWRQPPRYCSATCQQPLWTAATTPWSFAYRTVPGPAESP